VLAWEMCSCLFTPWHGLPSTRSTNTSPEKVPHLLVLYRDVEVGTPKDVPLTMGFPAPTTTPKAASTPACAGQLKDANCGADADGRTTQDYFRASWTPRNEPPYRNP